MYSQRYINWIFKVNYRISFCCFLLNCPRLKLFLDGNGKGNLGRNFHKNSRKCISICMLFSLRVAYLFFYLQKKIVIQIKSNQIKINWNKIKTFTTFLISWSIVDLQIYMNSRSIWIELSRSIFHVNTNQRDD